MSRLGPELGRVVIGDELQWKYLVFWLADSLLGF